MGIPDRTEVEWSYDPPDFFESDHRVNTADYELLFRSGQATAALASPQDPVSEDLERTIEKHVRTIMLTRQLKNRREYKVTGPHIYQHEQDKKHVTVRVGSAVVMCSAGQVDLVTTDSEGRMVRDTRAERIADDGTELDFLAAKALKSRSLHGMLESYSRSISDPNNELVHLYEVRDAIAEHYGSEAAGRAALSIRKTEWQTLGFLSNVEALNQGRHRGKHTGVLRPATADELTKARTIVLRWIRAFADDPNASA